MSTNKSEHYQLNLWEPGDDFLREEFNENFTRIDRIPEVVTGSYTGDGTLLRVINLGFRPEAVLVTNQAGGIQSGQTSHGGFTVDGHPCVFASTILVEVVDDGFRVARGYPHETTYWADTNATNADYYFLAVKA